MSSIKVTMSKSVNIMRQHSLSKISHCLFINLSEKIDTWLNYSSPCEIDFHVIGWKPISLKYQRTASYSSPAKRPLLLDWCVSFQGDFIVGVSENTIHLVCVMTGASISCVILSSAAKAHDAPPPSSLQLWWKPGWSPERRNRAVLVLTLGCC